MKLNPDGKNERAVHQERHVPLKARRSLNEHMKEMIM